MNIAIIQARMGSSRLPGKVLMEIDGKPMLWHVVNRVRQTILIDKVIVATTMEDEDHIIANFCTDEKIEIYRGEGADVLDRYYKTAKFFDADTIVRITADCPLISPVIIDKVLENFIVTNVDFVSNVIIRTYPKGLDVEVISFKALKDLWYNTTKCRHREHVTLYIYENLKKFKTFNIANDKDFSHLEWSVDTEKDLERIRNIFDYARFSDSCRI